MDEIFQTIYGHDAFSVLYSKRTNHPFIDPETKSVYIYTDDYAAEQKLRYYSFAGYRDMLFLKSLSNCYEMFTELCHSLAVEHIVLNDKDAADEPVSVTIREMYDEIPEKGHEGWVGINRIPNREIVMALQDRDTISPVVLRGMLATVLFVVPVHEAYSSEDTGFLAQMYDRNRRSVVPVFLNCFSMREYFERFGAVLREYEACTTTGQKMQELMEACPGQIFVLEPLHINLDIPALENVWEGEPL